MSDAQDRLRKMIEDAMGGGLGGMFAPEKKQTVSCSNCGQKNAVLVSRLTSGKQARCGKCGLPMRINVK